MKALDSTPVSVDVSKCGVLPSEGWKKATDSPPDNCPTLPVHSHWETTPTLPGPVFQSQNAELGVK